MKKGIPSNFITGLLVLAPLAAVLWVVLRIWSGLMGLSLWIPQSFHPAVFFQIESPIAIWFIDLLITIFTLFVIAIFVWAAGFFSRNYLGAKLFKAIRTFLARVPVLSTIYSTLEQLLDTFATNKAKNFRRVVYLEYPRPGIFTLALVTGERSASPITGLPGKHLTVFIPTTPNPTSGFYLIVPETDVKDAGLSVEQALKEIISMGIVQKHA